MNVRDPYVVRSVPKGYGVVCRQVLSACRQAKVNESSRSLAAFGHSLIEHIGKRLELDLCHEA